MKKKKRADLAENVPELLRELAVLRTFVDESVQQFSLDVKARIDEIAHVLGTAGCAGCRSRAAGPAPGDEDGQAPGDHSAVIPREGRVKDLKRIHDLVSLLSEALLSRE